MGVLLSGIFGGLLRVVPEVLGFFDKKNDRQHELELSKLQIEQIKAEGSIRMDEKRADLAVGELTAIQAGVTEQGTTARASYKWVSALSALVRPTVTWGLVILYAAVKWSMVAKFLDGGMPVSTALSAVWTTDDMNVMTMTLNFWFVGRVWERFRK